MMFLLYAKHFLRYSVFVLLVLQTIFFKRYYYSHFKAGKNLPLSQMK